MNYFNISKLLSISNNFFKDDDYRSTGKFFEEIDLEKLLYDTENSFTNTEMPDIVKLWEKAKTELHIKNSTIKQEILQSQTNDSEVALKNNVDQLKEKFTNSFLQLIQSVDFEFGYKTAADDFVYDSLNSYGVYAREWLNDIFLKNFESPNVLSAILRIIAHFDYSQMYPQGITIAIAATRHEDVAVQECGIRCFENWESPDSLPILKSLKFSEKWLNEYLSNVIMDLEHIGEKCLS